MGVPLAGVCKMLGGSPGRTAGSSHPLPPRPPARPRAVPCRAGALFPNAASPAPSPAPRGAAALPLCVPPRPRLKPEVASEGRCPESRSGEKVFPLRCLPGPGTRRDSGSRCPGCPQGAGWPAAPASLRDPPPRGPADGAAVRRERAAAANVSPVAGTSRGCRGVCRWLGGLPLTASPSARRALAAAEGAV